MLCVRAAARKQRLSKLRTSYPYHSGNPSQNVVRRACIHHPHSSVCVWLHWRRLDLGSRVTDVAPCLPYGALLTQRDLQHFQSFPWARNVCLPFHLLGFLQNSENLFILYQVPARHLSLVSINLSCQLSLLTLAGAEMSSF